MTIENCLRYVEYDLHEPCAGECYVLQRLPIDFRVRYYHDTLESAQKAKKFYEERYPKNPVRILRIAISCEEVVDEPAKIE